MAEAASATDSSLRTVYRTCPLCEATCGLEITLQGDRVVRTRGDREDVFSRGFICPKGTTLGDLQDDPDRLRRPLLRRGGEHVEVEWDEAFAAVEERLLPILDEHGRDAVAAYVGNPNVHGLAGTLFLRPLLKALGTRNIYSASTVDQMPKHVSSGWMFGGALSVPIPDIDRTHTLLMLGANPWESNGSLCTAPDFPGRLRALRRRGGRVVVVDPRRTRSAREADEHLPIQPGTDALLLCALLHVLFADERIELGDLREHVEGLDALRHAVSPFAPERVAPVCRIDAERIRRLAHELTDAPSAAVYGRIGTHTVEFGTLAAWAVDALHAVTGNLDRPGGAMFPLPAHAARRAAPGGRGFATGRWQSRVRGLPEANGELPVATLADEIATAGEGQVRALFTIAGNPVLSTPDGARLDAALAGLDFMVSVDLYLNETTRHADVIFPANPPLERSHFDMAFGSFMVRNVANYSEPAIERSGLSECETLTRLALIAAGQGAKADPGPMGELALTSLARAAVGDENSPVFGRDANELLAALGDGPIEDRVLDLRLRVGAYGDGFGSNPDGLSLDRLRAHPHGIDLGPMQPRIPELLSTPSGRVELAPPGILEDLARLEASIAAPRPAFVLVGRRDLRSNNSWMHNLERLVSGKPRCTLQIHPEDARELGLVDGAAARVRSATGELEAPVEVCDELLRGVVSLPHGWGHDAKGARLGTARRHAGVNSNLLTDRTRLDPLSGNAVLNGIPVEIAPSALG